MTITGTIPVAANLNNSSAISYVSTPVPAQVKAHSMTCIAAANLDDNISGSGLRKSSTISAKSTLSKQVPAQVKAHCTTLIVAANNVSKTASTAQAQVKAHSMTINEAAKITGIIIKKTETLSKANAPSATATLTLTDRTSLASSVHFEMRPLLRQWCHRGSFAIIPCGYWHRAAII